MKKPILICLMAILALSACKKGSSNPSTSATITGRWYYKSTIYTVTKNGITIPVDTEKSNGNYYVSFNSDGTGSSTDSDYFTPTFLYKVASSNLLLTETRYIDSANGQVPNTDTFSIPIKKLTNNTLEIYVVTGSPGDIENYDVTYSR